jgi:hypothetical protein
MPPMYGIARRVLMDTIQARRRGRGDVRRDIL